MAHRLWILLVLVPLMPGTAAAQDAKAILQAAAKAMGAESVKSIRFSGAGSNTAMGQSYDPGSGDLYPVQGLAHANTMLIAYLPKEKMLVNADLYSPPAPGAQRPAGPSASMVTFRQNIQRLKLDVVQHVPIHGRPGPMEEFESIVGKGTN